MIDQRPARLGLVSPRYPPATGGVERCVEVIATAAARAGISVEVLTTDPSARLAPVDETDGVLIRRFRTLPRGDTFHLSPTLAWWLLRHAGRFDVIHGHSYHTPLALVAALAAGLHRVPFVVTPYYHGGGHTPARNALHRLYGRFGAWMVRRARLVICQSRAECVTIREAFGGDLPTVVALPGVDVEPFRDAEPFASASPVVLTGGRLEGYKQFDRIVAAMAHLPADVTLVVFGDGPARPAIEAEVERLGLGARVRLLGRVDETDLARWFRTAAVFTSMSRKEAFGLTLVEAAAAGSAVVASDVPAYRELAERLGPERVTLVDVDADPGTVATAIAGVLGRRPGPVPANVLPTWTGMASDVLDGYGRVLRRPVVAGQVAE